MQDGSGSSSKLASTIFIGKWTVETLSCLRQEPYRDGELLRELKSCLSAHPYENVSQSRNRWIGSQARDEIKIRCR